MTKERFRTVLAICAVVWALFGLLLTLAMFQLITFAAMGTSQRCSDCWWSVFGWG